MGLTMTEEEMLCSGGIGNLKKIPCASGVIGKEKYSCINVSGSEKCCCVGVSRRKITAALVVSV